MKQFRYILFIIIASIVAGMISSCQQTGGTQIAEGGGTLTVGKLVDENGKPVVGDTVTLYSANEQKLIKKTTTDINGEYKFDSLPAQVLYTFIGSDAGKSKMVFRGPFSRDSFNVKTDLKTDTVYPPGNIQGCVTYPLVANLKSVVTIYIPGTSYIATVDSSKTSFTMSNVPKGVYTLKFTGASIGLTSSGIKVESALTTQFSTCFALENDTIAEPSAPVVDSIALLNADKALVQVKWRKVIVADLKLYEVYRSDSVNGSPLLVGTTSDTVFIDTSIFKNRASDTFPKTVSYQIKSKDQNNNASIYSEKLTIKVYPPSYYVTKVELSIKSKRANDTITNKDTVIAIATYRNNKRAPQNIRWSEGSLSNVIGLKEAKPVRNADSSWSGIDTLVYWWATEGKKQLFVEVDDGAGAWSKDTSTIDVWDYVKLYPHDVWKTLENLSEPRMSAAAVVLGSTIYIIGGKGSYYNFSIGDTSRLVWNTVETYNAKTLKKTDTISSYPDTVQSHCAVVVDSTIYVFGGANINGRMKKNIYSFKNGVKDWTKCSVTLPVTLSGMSACVYNSMIYIFGGTSNGRDVIRDIYMFDTKLMKITKVGSLNNPRIYHKSVLLNGKIYIIGGRDETTALSEIEVFDPVTKNITPGPSLLSPRINFCASVIGSKVYLFGGTNSNETSLSTIHNDIEYIDYSNGEYGIISGNFGSHSNTMVSYESLIFSFGGNSDINAKYMGTTNAMIYYP